MPKIPSVSSHVQVVTADPPSTWQQPAAAAKPRVVPFAPRTDSPAGLPEVGAPTVRDLLLGSIPELARLANVDYSKPQELGKDARPEGQKLYLSPKLNLGIATRWLNNVGGATSFRASDGKELQQFPTGKSAIDAVGLHPSLPIAALWVGEDHLHLVNLKTGETLVEKSCQAMSKKTLVFTADGAQVIAGSQVLDARSLEPVDKPWAKLIDGPLGVYALSPDGTLFAAVQGDGSKLIVWDLIDDCEHFRIEGEVVKTAAGERHVQGLTYAQRIEEVKFSRDSRSLLLCATVFTGGQEKSVVMLDRDGGGVAQVRMDYPSGFQFTPDNQHIVIGTPQGVSLCRAQDLGVVKTLDTAPFPQIAVSFDGRTLHAMPQNKRGEASSWSFPRTTGRTSRS
jgi:hypothetical protein